MENQQQKWVQFSLVAFAALVSYVLLLTGQKVAASFDLEARIRSIDIIVRVGALVIGAGVFVGIYRNAKAMGFLNEVVTELSNVTWPTTTETRNNTVIVIIAVLIAGVVLGLLDMGWTKALEWIL
jgi:preprotein translocase SecE subunit